MATTKTKKSLNYPKEVLAPVNEYLSEKLTSLEKKKSQLKESDPFEDSSRLTDNAAIDSDASEQIGHMQNTAVRSTYDRGIIQVRKALTRLKIGKYGICERCGKMIDTDRLMVMPETTLCVDCETKREK
jgi:DnaK suppressor protein